jgi:transcriptional regulator GlxA family with amidase domain
MKQVDVSRRWLHDQFQRLLNRTPYQYLCDLRVERAKLLLVVPGQVKLRTVAVACGFPPHPLEAGLLTQLRQLLT